VADVAKKLPREGTGGHGGMDFVMRWRIIQCLREGLPLDQDVYDAATWSAIAPLTEQSVAQGGMPIDVPDFTRGAWTTGAPSLLVVADTSPVARLAGRVPQESNMNVPPNLAHRPLPPRPVSKPPPLPPEAFENVEEVELLEDAELCDEMDDTEPQLVIPLRAGTTGHLVHRTSRFARTISLFARYLVGDALGLFRRFVTAARALGARLSIQWTRASFRAGT
jgi:hypothetical protein